ncbi:hypothetical protein A2159_00830 [Candidatus Woesebacteria bacterium RBG_13_34_9]|uniref:Acetyl-CoA acetyltransferase n=1 Tax=Candidatus Woesebacteria bacterium RBG_13_34_9 TaxID=1802477 RepID=A0A1F7X303_9BACT|nr:MAG: hypothetical protein A2159_00830 [Candidatus Woesebacteria bacterium RBG_13_34_9]
MKPFVIGVGVTKFGELWDISPRNLVKEAVTQALADSGITISEIDAVFVGNMLSGVLGNQENLGALYNDELGLKGVPAFKIEGACASGGLAFHNALNSILANKYKTCLVIGVEKMTDHKPEEITNALMAAAHEEERTAGLTFPGLYAILARAYCKKYKITEKDLASVSVESHYHAALNPKAQFPFKVTLKQVMESNYIADPLKLLECSPISDGAAALIVAGFDGKKMKRGVEVIASEVATDSLGLSGRNDLTTLKSTVLAAKKAYEQAKIVPSDVDVAEVHDCFSIAQVLALEDLGFFKKGTSLKEVIKGKIRLGSGAPVVNPSGGLKACGHPIGASGVKQIVEITIQLRGEAGKRQVEGAKIGLTHNVGGSGAIAIVNLLKI